VDVGDRSVVVLMVLLSVAVAKSGAATPAAMAEVVHRKVRRSMLAMIAFFCKGRHSHFRQQSIAKEGE
jgi:hypothetical protein